MLENFSVRLAYLVDSAENIESFKLNIESRQDSPLGTVSKGTGTLIGRRERW